MASLTRWDPFRFDPFRELEDFSERFNRMAGLMPQRRESGREAMTVADWIPTVDVAEDDREFLIKAEIPEVEKRDVKVMVQDGVLTLQGVRKQEVEQNGKRFHRVERSYGSFVRSFTLPENADEKGMRAEFKDGMLTIHVPKSEEPKSRAMEIKVQ
jgi:HSP20 family protein